jgi:hypothetical protein
VSVPDIPRAFPMPIREIGASLVGVINEKAPPFSTGLSVRKEHLGDPSGFSGH